MEPVGFGKSAALFHIDKSNTKVENFIGLIETEQKIHLCNAYERWSSSTLCCLFMTNHSEFSSHFTHSIHLQLMTIANVLNINMIEVRADNNVEIRKMRRNWIIYKKQTKILFVRFLLMVWAKISSVIKSLNWRNRRSRCCVLRSALKRKRWTA